jgi:hypothetical protein
MEPKRQEMALGSEWLIISTDEELDALINDLMEITDDGHDEDDESLDETWDAEEEEQG